MSRLQLKIFALLLGMGAIITDQLLKFIILWKIPSSGIFLVSSKFLSIQLELAKNPFIAFSLPLPQVLIFVLTIILLSGLIYFLIKSLGEHKGTTIALSLIIGAAISNLIDRLIHGAVIDYLNITIYNYHWATFNLADSLITICALIILIINFRKKI